jgi:hypothetical protein
MKTQTLLSIKTTSSRIEALASDNPPGSSLRIRVVGAISDEIDFESLKAQLKPILKNFKSVVFDLGETARISSMGARAWAILTTQLNMPYSFSSVSSAVVELYTLYPQFIGPKGTRVDSIMLPYFCDKCNASSSTLAKLDQVLDANGNFAAPAPLCSKCGSPLDFDSTEDDYRDFAKNCRK